MKVSLPKHKDILINIFFDKLEGYCDANGRPRHQAHSFPIDELAEAGSALKKLRSCVSAENVINDNEIEFTPAEITVLKNGFDRLAKQGFGADDAEHVLSLKKIFDGKEDPESKT